MKLVNYGRAHPLEACELWAGPPKKKIKKFNLGVGAQADTIPNRRQGQRSKVPELSVLSTCAIEVSTPHQITQIF